MEALARELLGTPGGVELVVEHLSKVGPPAGAAGPMAGGGEARCPVEGCTVAPRRGVKTLPPYRWLARQLSGGVAG